MELQDRLKQEVFNSVRYLDERQRRIAGRGRSALYWAMAGHSSLPLAAGMSRPAYIRLRRVEQTPPGVPLGSSRKSGAGGKPLVEPIREY